GRLGQTLDVAVIREVDTTGVKEQVPQLVEQREYLPGLGAGVVDVDDGEFVVVEAKAEVALRMKGIFEHEDANASEDIAPLLQRVLCARPLLLLLKRHPE